MANRSAVSPHLQNTLTLLWTASWGIWFARYRSPIKEISRSKINRFYVVERNVTTVKFFQQIDVSSRIRCTFDWLLLILSLLLSLTHSHIHSFYHSLTLCCSLTHSLTHSHSHSHSHSLTHTHTHTLSHIHSLSHSLTLRCSLIHSFTLILIYSFRFLNPNYYYYYYYRFFDELLNSG
jgi:hypothetical protein